MLRRFASVLIGVLAAGMFLVAGPTNALAQAEFFRWDILTTTLKPGGMASALANDGSMITLTGTGTFLATPSRGRFSALVKRGGGTWKTSTASGTYRTIIGPGVWKVAPGTLSATREARAGLLFAEIVYSDGERGVLVIGCSFGKTNGTPASVLEGVTASKGFVDYWKPVVPAPTVFTSIPRP